jgi:hypothetical protein
VPVKLYWDKLYKQIYHGLFSTLAYLIIFSTSLAAQSFLKPADSLNTKRVYTVSASWAAIYGTALVGLNTAWYANYERGPFHFYNDAAEWQQMDKAGHLFTNYFEAKWTADALQWAGVQQRNAAFIGISTGLLFQTTLETLDGFSAEWGFSPSDMMANTSGALIFLSQELIWKEQRIQVKFSTSFSNTPYVSGCNCDLVQRNNNLFGKSFPEQTLKNYNKQTYWLSANLHSFLPQFKLPPWLSVAVGYGAEGMLGGYENVWFENGQKVVAADVSRTRQFYLSPDVDFTKIKTNKPVLKTLFTMLNIFKMPMPALMFNNTNQLKFYPLYF